MKLKPATLALLRVLSDENVWTTAAAGRSAVPRSTTRQARQRLHHLANLGLVEMIGSNPRRQRRWAITDAGQAVLKLKDAA